MKAFWVTPNAGCGITLVKSCTHATPKRTIRFCDGSVHEVGQYYEITPDTLSYFIVNQKDYHFCFNKGKPEKLVCVVR